MLLCGGESHHHLLSHQKRATWHKRIFAFLKIRLIISEINQAIRSSVSSLSSVYGK